MMKRLFALLLCLLMLSPAVMAEETAAPILQVHQMMLGFADGYLIRCGDVDIMIDGGNPNPALPTDDVVSYLRAAGVETLDAYIITHWHLDHCMNMNIILSEFGDENTVVYGPSAEPPEVVKNGSVVVPMSPLASGTYCQMKMHDVLTIGGMTFTCIGPEKLQQNGGSNPDSLNFVLQYGERRFLFTGDFAQSGSINDEYKELCSSVDVLKFPHHGMEPYEIGKKATRVVSPTWVIVPGVAGKYSLWQWIANCGTGIVRENIITNADGHVVILTDGGERFDVLSQQNPADYAPGK